MRIVKLGFIVLLFSSLFITAERAEAKGNTYEVGVSVLHVRESPNNQSNIIGTLHKGDQLTAFDEKFGWVQTYYGGEVAWVAKHYLISTSKTETVRTEQTQHATDSVTITASSVHIRSGPGTHYEAIAGTSAGEQFTQLRSTDEWVKISLPNGTTGWVASWLTSVTNEGAPEPQSQSAPSQKTENNTASGSLAGQTIVLDAGHGGRDPGAIGINGVYEKDLVLSTTTRLAEVLRQHGASVVETRISDEYVGLEERSYVSNNEGADAFISVHYNAFPIVSVQGIHTFYGDERSYALANSVHTHLASAVHLNDRGINQADYKVLRPLHAPGILVELGFITNSYDLSVVTTADYQYRAAEAIAQGLIDYFN